MRAANPLRLPSGNNSTALHCKKSILLFLTLVLITLIPLEYLPDEFPFFSRSKQTDANISLPFHQQNESSSPLQVHEVDNYSNESSISARLGQNCNLFRGTWVPYPQGPYYTNKTGCVIEDAQNCIKFGRPDTEFMKWRWKPDDCELPLFDARRFLGLVRGKSMAFVGDSVARNQVQSLACLLSSTVGSRPVDKSYKEFPRFRRWVYTEYNFTLAVLLTTHLVKTGGVNALTTNSIDLYLDEVEQSWASQIENFDYVIISAGHWFSRPLMYYEKGKLMGCSMCTKENVTDLPRYYGLRKAYRTAFRTLLDHEKFKGTVILRTITPTHFETEDSEGRGNCVRTRPFAKGEMKLDWDFWMLYLIQVEEFLAAQREGSKKGLKFKLLDITEAMRPRADGHPNHYGHPPEVRFMLYSDCLHWCLPGAIDTWNELLLQALDDRR